MNSINIRKDTTKSLNSGFEASACAGSETSRYFSSENHYRNVADLTAKELAAEREKVLHGIYSVFDRIMTADGPSARAWSGTMIDLIELVHIVWMSQRYTDRRGHAMRFIDMVRHVFIVLHCHPVANPYNFVRRAANRKGITGTSVLNRYLALAVNAGIRNPMALDMKG